MADLNVLMQLIISMNEAVGKLEEAKGRGDAEQFNKLKILILELQKKINAEIEG